MSAASRKECNGKRAAGLPRQGGVVLQRISCVRLIGEPSTYLVCSDCETPLTACWPTKATSIPNISAPRKADALSKNWTPSQRSLLAIAKTCGRRSRTASPRLTQIENPSGSDHGGQSETLVASYGRRVEKLEREKLLLNEKLGTHAKSRQRASQEFDPVLRFQNAMICSGRMSSPASKQA